MPGLDVFLKHLMKKYPEMAYKNIGVQYAERHDLKGAAYRYVGAPLQGSLEDERGVRRCQMIELNEYLKHSENLVKVGAIADALTSIYLEEKNERESSPLRKFGMLMLDGKFAKEITREMGESDIGSRGLVRPHEAFEKYVDNLDEDKIGVLMPKNRK